MKKINSPLENFIVVIYLGFFKAIAKFFEVLFRGIK